jgi:phosphatidylglycerol:prolipoprotein diacylglycerol transferase
MFPTIIKLGPIAIRTYGLLVAVGLFAGLQYILKRRQKDGITEEQIFDLILYVIVAGLVGARITYVLFNWSFYAQHLGEIFKVWEGGLVYYGGLISGALMVLGYVRLHPGIKLWPLADVIAPALALGHFFGRLGCFFAGCCYGLPCNLPWAVRFTNNDSFAPLNISLHPTQLYEAIGNISIFIILDRLYGKRHVDGTVFTVYLFLYGLMRFMIEFLRGDERGAFFFHFSPSQVFSLCLIAVSVIILWFRRETYETALNRQ